MGNKGIQRKCGQTIKEGNLRKMKNRGGSWERGEEEGEGEG